MAEEDSSSVAFAAGTSMAESFIAPVISRQKRSQVSRACNACRTHRSKCDNNRPCSNCKKRGTQCSNTDATNLSAAQREIQRLTRQVQGLRQELEHEWTRNRQAEIREVDTGPLFHKSHLPQGALNAANTPHLEAGLHISTARSQHETWYGPSSLFYFIRQVTTVMGSKLQQNLLAAHVIPQGASRLLNDPTSSSSAPANLHRTTLSEEYTTSGILLSATQEEYFLDLFWKSYHTSLFPIVDETDFKEHYRSLWLGSSSTRGMSALVDIVLALCMQYGISMLPIENQGALLDNQDATVAGRWYYRRCQTLLAHEMESPSLSTLQCHILCCVYLCCGTFQNLSDSACGLAIRTAYMLGLQLHPHSSMPLKTQELHKRIWWSLYILESKIGMKLGRPFTLHDSGPVPGLPGDGIDAAACSGSTFASLGEDCTWLSFHSQHIKLFQVARECYTRFFQEPTSAVGQSLRGDAQAISGSLTISTVYRMFEEWASAVPDGLKTKRKGTENPYSTDFSSLEIEQFAPVWLQRQRLMLELMYHNLRLNLYRPYITFTDTPNLPQSETAARCAAHATTLTRMIHQVLSTTSILDGWHEAFQWQWNAAMTLVGFVLVQPHDPTASANAARNALDLSIAVFDMFGKNFAVASSAAAIIRDLVAKISLLRGNTLAIPDSHLPSESVEISGTRNESASILGMNSQLDHEGLNLASGQDVFDMAMAVDLWGDFDTLWPHVENI